ncbi:MAG: 50S ribosomal protein L3 N(5)-glutamine methyltransferase [gamma proteobacterium symbiont of Bathyaustriella thionipta]|nr:50S ribosomal protein L3 N(5)-glutamine methyltransferase [gamma proteobacterium symbiont of Bathyaustriella thionipta]
MNNQPSLQDAIRQIAGRFEKAGLHYGHGTDNALDEAAWLVLAIAETGYELTEKDYQKILSAEQWARINKLATQRIEQLVPLAYLLKEAWFAGLPFYVDEHVLVPRSPFAELIAERFSPWIDGHTVGRILDMCTGSGCIGIACAKAFGQAQVDMSDISPQALEIAQRNIQRHALQERVQVFQSDLFEQLPQQRYDIIVSNPPYVSSREMQQLPAEYRAEPELALLAAEQGLALVKRQLQQAAHWLTEKGILLVEVGLSMQRLQQAYPQVPFMWLQFEQGGEGVFLLTRSQLQQYFQNG